MSYGSSVFGPSLYGWGPVILNTSASDPYNSGPTIDQLELYDTAILNWLRTDYAGLIPCKSVQVLIASPHRYYMDVETQQFVDQTRLTVPRITITRGNYTRDPNRFNVNTIRALGKVGNQGLSRLYQEKYPVPINISYQVDFWTEFARDMNIWAQLFLYQMGLGQKYLRITVDTMWLTKMFSVFPEGDLVDNSELEPQEEHREIRRTATLRAEGWLYGQVPDQAYVVKRIFSEFYDYDTETHMETVSPNRQQTLWTSPGGQTVFPATTLQHIPILENSFVLSSRFGGVELVAQDDGGGGLFGPNVASGVIDYVTGQVNITYSTAPDAGALRGYWLTDLD